MHTFPIKRISLTWVGTPFGTNFGLIERIMLDALFSPDSISYFEILLGSSGSYLATQVNFYNIKKKNQLNFLNKNIKFHLIYYYYYLLMKKLTITFGSESVFGHISINIGASVPKENSEIFIES